MHGIYKDDQGLISFIFALLLSGVLLLFTCGVIDLNANRLLDQRLQQASDAAIMVAAVTLAKTDSKPQAVAAAHRFFKANYGVISYGNINFDTDVTIIANPDDTFSISAHATRDTLLGLFSSASSSTIENLSNVTAVRGSITTMAAQPIFIALALDLTESMHLKINGTTASNSSDSRIAISKVQINNLVNAFPANERIFFSIVPYTDLVRLSNAGTGTSLSPYMQGTIPVGSWGGCPMAREGTMDINLSAPNPSNPATLLTEHPGIAEAYQAEQSWSVTGTGPTTVWVGEQCDAWSEPVAVSEGVVSPPVCLSGYVPGHQENCSNCYIWEVTSRYHLAIDNTSDKKNICNDFSGSVNQLSPIIPLKNNYLSISSLINNYNPVTNNIGHYFNNSDNLHLNRFGHTQNHIGLLWAARTLMPDWYSFWGIETTMANPSLISLGEPVRHILLVTDGENTHNGWGTTASYWNAYSTWDEMMNQDWWGADSSWDNSPYQSSTTAHTVGLGEPGDTTLARTLFFDSAGLPLPSAHNFGSYPYGITRLEANDKFTETCNLIKDNDIIIYAISLNISNPQAQDLLRTCVTDGDMYFNATNETTLNTAFGSVRRTIQTGAIRMAQ
jgi:hypothetical protein